MSTTKPEADENYTAEFDAYNQQLLDEQAESDKPVKSHYAKNDKLGMISTACLIINRMIGTGIFLTPSTVLRGTESVGASLIFWLLGALIAFAGLAVYLELGLTIPRRRLVVNGESKDVYVPRSGGEKNYKRPRYAASCIYAVIFVILGNTAANALAFSEYILICFDNKAPSLWVLKAYAILAITLACVLHGVWRAGGIWLMNIFALFKIIILLVIISLGFAVRGGGFDGVRSPTENLDPDNAFSGGSEAYGFAVALLAIRFSYGGFENANYVLSEIDRPQKRLKYSTLSALTLVSVLYMFANIAYFLVIPKESVATAGNKVAFEFFNIIFGKESSAAVRGIPAIVAMSAIGNLIAVTFVAAKVKQEIAKEGVLPFSRFWSKQFRFFSRSHHHDDGVDLGPTRGETPIPALLLHWIVSMILVIAPQTKDAYTLLSNLYSYTIQACIGLLLAAGLLYKRYNKDGWRWRELRGFTPWLGPVLPVFSLIANLFMVIAPWIHPPGSKALTMPGIKWFVFPTVGFTAFGVGLLYWAVFYYIVPRVKGKVLNVKIIPYFDRDDFVLEAVYSKWVVEGGADSDVEDDVDLR